MQNFLFMSKIGQSTKLFHVTLLKSSKFFIIFDWFTNYWNFYVFNTNGMKAVPFKDRNTSQMIIM